MTKKPRAIILAAGLGTRLGKLSDQLPKPLLPVCDIPLIRYAIALVRAAGVEELAINLHHHGALIQNTLGDGSAFGMRILYASEQTLLGTGGPLKRLAAFLTHNGSEPFFVVNGKILIDLDLDDVLRRHRATGALATLVVQPAANDTMGGVPSTIDSDAEGRITRILDAGAANQPNIFTGVHVIEPRLIDRLPEGVSDSVRQGYIPALLAGERLTAYPLRGYFFEHSNEERYLQGNFNALDGTANVKHLPGPLHGIAKSAHISEKARIDQPVLIGDNAHVGDGAVVGPYVVVGHGAEITPGTELSRCVVWPGVKVDGTHHGRILSS